MSEVKASILVVTYNQEKYLAACLDSLIAQQTELPYEILVGDDASTDGTAEVLRRYAAAYPDRVVAVCREANLGATRNSFDLWQRARGAYIAFCDGDDCWIGADRLQRQVDFLDAHPEFSAVCGKSELMDEHGAPLSLSSLTKKQVFWQFDRDVFTRTDFAAWRMPCHDSAILARNPFHAEDGTLLYRAHPIVGDRTFLMLFLLHGDIAVQQEVVSAYRYILKGEHFMTEYARENHRDQDFQLMRTLECYAQARGWPLSLLGIKQERLIAAACIWLKQSTARNWNVLENIIRASEAPWRYAVWAVSVIVQKWRQIHIQHEEHPIRLGKEGF